MKRLLEAAEIVSSLEPHADSATAPASTAAAPSASATRRRARVLEERAAGRGAVVGRRGAAGRLWVT